MSRDEHLISLLHHTHVMTPFFWRTPRVTLVRRTWEGVDAWVRERTARGRAPPRAPG